MPALAAFFFLTALLYAAVGFGGGSTYNANTAKHEPGGGMAKVAC